MGTTPILGLPYPEDPDTPNVPRDMKALAMALDNFASIGQKIQVIDPKEADWGWNDLPRGSTSGNIGYSGAGQSTTWDTAPVLNPEARWKFTAPSDGVLMCNVFITLGYNNNIPGGTGIWQEFRMHGGTISGSVQGVHPNYARWIFRGSSGDVTEVVDNTLTIQYNLAMSAGAVVSPYVSWRGKLYKDGSIWRPKWRGGRMQAVFIPGAVERIDPPSNNSSQREAAIAEYTDDTNQAGFDLPDDET